MATILLPRGSLGTLLFVLGTLSLARVLVDAFKVGLNPWMAWAFATYEHGVSIAVAWLQPGLEEMASLLGGSALHPHWKHFFVLFTNYIWRSVSNSFRSHPPTGVFRFATGLLAASGVSAAAGTISIHDTRLPALFWIAMAPVLGLLFYGVVHGAWQAARNVRRHDEQSRLEVFAGHFKAACLRTLAATGFIAAFVVSPAAAEVPSPGVLILVVLVVSHALYNLWDGMRQVSRESYSSFWGTPSALIGLDMLRPFLWCVLIYGAATI